MCVCESACGKRTTKSERERELIFNCIFKFFLLIRPGIVAVLLFLFVCLYFLAKNICTGCACGCASCRVSSVEYSVAAASAGGVSTSTYGICRFISGSHAGAGPRSSFPLQGFMKDLSSWPTNGILQLRSTNTPRSLYLVGFLVLRSI